MVVESETLAGLCDALLAKLLTGEIELPEAMGIDEKVSDVLAGMPE